MAITGLRDTSNFVADQRPKNWRESILLLYPNATAKMPLTALTSLMKSQPTDDPEFKWWEKSLPTQRVALAANLTTSNDMIQVVGGASQFKLGHVLLVEQTNEVLYVVADPSSDTFVQVVRGFANTTPTAVTYNGVGVNPNIRVIGSAYREGSTAPTGINYDPTKNYNYTQIFRNTMEMTRTARKTQLRTGDQVKEARRECLELHSIEMEKAFLWGQRFETTFQGNPLRMTGGITTFIPASNIIDAGPTTDMQTLEEWLERIFRYGSDEKIAFSGNRGLLIIQQIIRKNSEVQIMSGIKEFGMNVTRLICPFGTLVLYTHALFNQLRGGITGGSPYVGRDGDILVIDQTNLRYRYIDDVTYQGKLDHVGVDALKAGYLTEAGLEVHHPDTHFWIRGLRAAAVDA